MRSITLIGAVAVAAIAILVFLPSSMSEEQLCLKGKSECPDEGTACVFLKKNNQVCKPLAKHNETCNYKKGNKKGQFFKHPPCEPGLVCRPYNNDDRLGICK